MVHNSPVRGLKRLGRRLRRLSASKCPRVPTGSLVNRCYLPTRRYLACRRDAFFLVAGSFGRRLLSWTHWQFMHHIVLDIRRYLDICCPKSSLQVVQRHIPMAWAVWEQHPHSLTSYTVCWGGVHVPQAVIRDWRPRSVLESASKPRLRGRYL